MEVRKLRSLLLVACLVVGLLAGQTKAASFQECYVGCFILCAIAPPHNVLACATKCLKDCLHLNTLDNNVVREETPFDFCKLGCASSLCTNLSSKDNPGEEEVEGCVNACSGKCSKKYIP